MPYWPFPMACAAVLLLFGLRHGVWFAPMVVLLTYGAMRGVVAYVPVAFVEVAGCTLWLMCAAILYYKEAWVPGFFYALSGLTYPAALVFGFRLEYMGAAPFIAAVFGLFALIGMGGGIFGLYHHYARPDARPDNVGFLVRAAHYSLGMAARPVRD